MWSKNKKAMNQREREYIERIKEQPCVICDHPGPSEAHEIKQGQWFTSLPLCQDCHTGSLLGWHGQRRAWAVRKMDELDALNLTIERMVNAR